MEWIDTWDCKTCGATNSESRDVCHKCGHRRKRLVKPFMVPWILLLFVFGFIIATKLYVERNEPISQGSQIGGRGIDDP